MATSKQNLSNADEHKSTFCLTAAKGGPGPGAGPEGASWLVLMHLHLYLYDLLVAMFMVFPYVVQVCPWALQRFENRLLEP